LCRSLNWQWSRLRGRSDVGISFWVRVIALRKAVSAQGHPFFLWNPSILNWIDQFCDGFLQLPSIFRRNSLWFSLLLIALWSLHGVAF
jgi:hypothetical protein